MGEHVYQEDTRIVLKGNVRVADWRNELRHFELSLPVADMLLQKLSTNDNELGLNGRELLEVLQGQGEIANFVKLSHAKEKVRRTLAALTKIAWEHEVPFSVDEVVRAMGDEYFSDFNAAYAVSDGGEILNMECEGEIDG